MCDVIRLTRTRENSQWYEWRDTYPGSDFFGCKHCYISLINIQPFYNSDYRIRNVTVSPSLIALFVSWAPAERSSYV